MKKIVFVATLLLYSCGNKKNDDSPQPAAILSPEKATLNTPVSNSTCTTGRVISATQSAVIFTWGTPANADSYDLIIKNLLTGVSTTQTTSASQLEVTLSRNTPYSWYVVSKSAKTSTTAQSDSFKFYNSGVAATFYAPFPADIVVPSLGQSLNATGGKVNLSWTASDVDNDITGYDVYLGTSANNVIIVKSDVTASTFEAVVVKGTTYYWKIVTKDSQANTSTSPLYQFIVN